LLGISNTKVTLLIFTIVTSSVGLDHSITIVTNLIDKLVNRIQRFIYIVNYLYFKILIINILNHFI